MIAISESFLKTISLIIVNNCVSKLSTSFIVLVIFPCFIIFSLTHTHFFSLPPVVRGLTADFVNATTLRISWDAAIPDQNVTGYDVIVFKENTSVSQVAVDNSTFSVVVLSLDQCDNYTVKVAANSSVGIGNYSTFQFVTRCGESLVLLYFLSCHNYRTPCLQTCESQCCSTTLSRVWSLNEGGSCPLFKRSALVGFHLHATRFRAY